MSRSPVQIVFHKELRDGFRDRRALTSALLTPLLGPLLIALMLSQISDEEELEGQLELAVVGEQYAPNLIAHLEMAGVELVEAPNDPVTAVESGEEDVVLVIDDKYAEQFTSSKPARIELILDDSKRSTSITAMRVKRVLESYSQKVTSHRLMARGMAPSVIRPLDVVERDLATPQTRASNILEMIGMFLIIAAFTCNMYIAIDATAGERERGSLEPLLIQPIRRWQLVLGKWLATVAFGIIGATLTLLCMLTAMHQLPLENLGLRLVLGVTESIQLMLVCIPLICFAGAVQLTLAAFAKSFKEAQTYLSFTLFAPMLPGLIFTMKPVEPALWMTAVPALGQQVLTTMTLRGDEISSAHWALATGSCFAGMMLSLWLCVRLFSSEHFFRKS